MQWDASIKAGDIAIVFATLLGPILAVQAQSFVERHRARRNRRQNIFYVLMRTRATPLAPDAVNALNSVPLEFYKDRVIIDAYSAFIAHTAPIPPCLGIGLIGGHAAHRSPNGFDSKNLCEGGLQI